ncbi:hypothetical protein VT84_17520 [Gemmata sp. SH-PL17]|uniref:TIGR03000 domain-containing protein n=1 Tax=Gemmata sp. SH-PL17 TaxID=1630693 RepID=UPI00078E1A0C|nr:TIGR03000 domain-containing protein [Gemmata sp. SH-PL17]AMV26202.1 hypothetical protein VT84_17520 [Gemmata sp. SH-PL17]
MYSIVMFTAMSAGADVTPPAKPAATPIATGCCGAVSVGCYGSCYGSSCHGSCHGGSFVGGRSNGFLGHRTSCNGYSCFGSCCGYSQYTSCFGSCRGCSGAFLYGSTWGPPIGMPPYTLHGYNSGASPVWGPGYPTNLTDPHAVYGTITNPSHPTNPNRPPVMTIPVAPAPKSTSDGQPMGANLKFTLPADAKLFVDGKPATGAGTERHFYTPPLAVGQKFFYEVKAELMVDGKIVVEEKKIIVEAGANLTERFPKLVAAVGTNGTVAGK